jgi:anti-sigma regulatory factor (Ser/Thr protein kinase)
MTPTPAHTILLRRDVHARTVELRAVRMEVERHAVRFGFAKEIAFRIALAVDEACANIIEHAYRNDPHAHFSIEVATDGESFVVTLTDAGIPFSHRRIPALDLFRCAREQRKGGLGLHLITRIMDAIEYGETDDRMNRLRLIKRKS